MNDNLNGFSRHDWRREDAKFLRQYAAGMSYNDGADEAAHKHRMNEIAMRLDVGLYEKSPDERAIEAMNRERAANAPKPAGKEWIKVNRNPFSPVAGEVLVDTRTLGNEAEDRCVPASEVRWADVIAYRVSELGAAKTVKPGCINCENAICDECGPARLTGAVIRDSSTIDKATSAPDLLDAAAGHMRDRAATYDKPEGERSMGKTVQAFNTITGRDLRESEGWLLLALLKMVRSEQRDAPHRDSVEDLIAYAALFGEARVGGQ